VHALQFLDVINMKDSTQKAHFYRNTLKDVLPYIPKVSDVIARYTFIGAKNVSRKCCTGEAGHIQWLLP
jgi:hypothetical protein